MPASFPVLAEPAVRRYLGGQACSIVGNWTQAITLNLLLWQQTGSPWLLGLLNFLLYGPVLVVAPVFGARLHPQRARGVVMAIVSVALLLGTLLLVLSLTGRLGSGVLLAIALALGVLAAMEMPARQLLLTTVLRNKAWMVNAIALNTLVFNMGRMLGPAIAALLFSRFDANAGFVLNLLGLTVMLLCLRALPRAEAPQDTGTTPARGVRPAWAHARTSAFARRALPQLALIGVFAGSYQTLIPVLAGERFGHAEKYTGIFFACAGAGSLLSGLLLASRHAARLRAVVDGAPWLCVLALIGIGLSGHALLTGLGFFLLGLAITSCATSTNAALQQHSPAELRGGMVGLYGMAFQGTMPIGHLIVGQLSSAWGVQTTFVLAGAAVAVGMWLLARASGHSAEAS